MYLIAYVFQYKPHEIVREFQAFLYLHFHQGDSSLCDVSPNLYTDGNLR